MTIITVASLLSNHSTSMLYFCFCINGLQHSYCGFVCKFRSYSILRNVTVGWGYGNVTLRQNDWSACATRGLKSDKTSTHFTGCCSKFILTAMFWFNRNLHHSLKAGVTTGELGCPAGQSEASWARSLDPVLSRNQRHDYTWKYSDFLILYFSIQHPIYRNLNLNV